MVNCLEAIKHSRPSCRFYNAGSSEEFGNVAYEPQDENHPERPRSPYGASKVSARQYVKVYRESYGLYAVQGWLFNHEGPRRGEEFVTRKITKGVARIFKAVVNNEKYAPIELGNLDAERDWSDAEDMMDAIWRMLNQEVYGKGFTDCLVNIQNKTFTEKTYTEFVAKNIVPKIKDYVVGSGEKHTIREFIEKSFEMIGAQYAWRSVLEKVNNRPFNPLDEKLFRTNFYPNGFGTIPMVEEPLVVINPKFYRPAEVDRLRADPTKIKNELGWKPKTTFEELVEKMITNDLTLIDVEV